MCRPPIHLSLTQRWGRRRKRYYTRERRKPTPIQPVLGEWAVSVEGSGCPECRGDGITMKARPPTSEGRAFGPPTVQSTRRDSNPRRAEALSPFARGCLSPLGHLCVL